jgi:hypothetical protein
MVDGSVIVRETFSKPNCQRVSGVKLRFWLQEVDLRATISSLSP